MDGVAKNYDCTILYHLVKDNVVANALSRKSMGSLAHIAPTKRPLVSETHKLEASVHFELWENMILLAHIRAQSSLVEWIKAMQGKHPKLNKLNEKTKSGKNSIFVSYQECVLHCGNRLYVLDYEALRETTLEESHNSKYLVHLGSAKMY